MPVERKIQNPNPRDLVSVSYFRRSIPKSAAGHGNGAEAAWAVSGALRGGGDGGRGRVGARRRRPAGGDPPPPRLPDLARARGARLRALAPPRLRPRRPPPLHPPRVLALRLASDWTLPLRQPRGLAAAARGALATLARSNVCDLRNGCLLVELDRDPAEFAAYAVRNLLRPAPDKPLPSPPRSSSSGLLGFEPGGGSGSGRFLLLPEDGGESDEGVSCVCFDLSFNSVKFCVEFSILRSGVWGVQRSPATELRENLMDIVVAQKLLVGSKFYMMTTLGYILGLDLVTASFFKVQLPDEARNSRTTKFAGGQHSKLYLVDAKGLQLCIWHGDGVGQWVLVDTISVREACGHLNVQRWKPDDGCTAPVKVFAVGDNAEFVILELVASGIVCCMQVGNRVVEKVAVGVLQNYTARVLPITMVWPPIFPVDKASQE